jgi:hypothetical protein
MIDNRLTLPSLRETTFSEFYALWPEEFVVLSTNIDAAWWL